MKNQLIILSMLLVTSTTFAAGKAKPTKVNEVPPAPITSIENVEAYVSLKTAFLDASSLLREIEADIKQDRFEEATSKAKASLTAFNKNLGMLENKPLTLVVSDSLNSQSLSTGVDLSSRERIDQSSYIKIHSAVTSMYNGQLGDFLNYKKRLTLLLSEATILNFTKNKVNSSYTDKFISERILRAIQIPILIKTCEDDNCAFMVFFDDEIFDGTTQFEFNLELRLALKRLSLNITDLDLEKQIQNSRLELKRFYGRYVTAKTTNSKTLDFVIGVNSLYEASAVFSSAQIVYYTDYEWSYVMTGNKKTYSGVKEDNVLLRKSITEYANTKLYQDMSVEDKKTLGCKSRGDLKFEILNIDHLTKNLQWFKRFRHWTTDCQFKLSFKVSCSN